MDFDLRSLAVHVVGWSMGLVGFLLSATISILTAILPPFRPRIPDDVNGRLRRRIQPRSSQEWTDHESLPPNTCSPMSDACSADSLPSVETARSERSTTRRMSSTPPTSLANSPEQHPQPLPQSAPTSNGKCEQVGSPIALPHTCTPEKCSNHASTSAAAAPSSPVAEEEPEKHEMNENNGGEGKMRKNARPLRGVSWMVTSQSPSLLQSQRTPRSSGECSRESGIALPRRSFTVDQDTGEVHPKPRRASTLLGFKRFSKAPTRSDSEVSPAPITSVSRTENPIPSPTDGRRSEPTSPSSGLHDLPGVPSEADRNVHERKRRVSYFARLRRMGMGKDTSKARTQQRDESAPLSPVSAIQPPLSPKPTIDERGRSREQRSSRKKSRRPTTAPTAPPRTNPYDAPYYFPTPVSPEAADYVRLARTEIRRTSVSPSAAARTPYRNDLTPIPSGMTPSRSASTVKKVSASHDGQSIPSIPGSAPPQLVNFVVSPPEKHRKSASMSGTALRVDEFGFVHPVTPISSREKRRAAKRTSLQ